MADRTQAGGNQLHPRSTCRASSARRRPGVGQAREPPAGLRLQGPRRGEPDRPAGTRRQAPRGDRRLDGQPRPVGGLRGQPVRGARDRLRARAGQPGEGRVDAGARRRGDLPRPRLRRGARVLREAGRRTRQRGGGDLPGGQGDPPVDRGDRRAVAGGAGGLPFVAGRGTGDRHHGHVRRGAGHPYRLRAAAADPARAARRLRAGLRGRAGRGDARDDREDPQSRRAGRRGRPRRGARRTRAVQRPGRRGSLQRRQHQPRAAS